jgi:hypothetical protein
VAITSADNGVAAGQRRSDAFDDHDVGDGAVAEQIKRAHRRRCREGRLLAPEFADDNALIACSGDHFMAAAADEKPAAYVLEGPGGRYTVIRVAGFVFHVDIVDDVSFWHFDTPA